MNTRYNLWRRLESTHTPALLWVMLNPSTADADVDDPTIRRCKAFSAREGYGALMVVNLSPIRVTNPKLLPSTPADIAERNRVWIRRGMRRRERAVVAWGAGVDRAGLADEVDFVRKVANENGTELVCLGRTRSGHPRHPLYVRADQPFETWE